MASNASSVAVVMFVALLLMVCLPMVAAADASIEFVWSTQADFERGSISGGLDTQASPGNMTLAPVPGAWSKSLSNPLMPQAPCGTWDYYHADIEAIDVLLEGGAFKMWYAGCYVGECAIGFATSADGSVWTRYARNPVLTNLRSTWESSLLTPQVVVSNGMYHMWYVGATSSAQPVEQIGYATSADGINWTETPASPVFRPSPGSWDEFSVAAPALLWEDPYYVLWYAGSRDDTSWSLGRAISTDGQNWTRDSANPLISPQLAWEGRSVYPGSILKQNGE